jgi:hypothetical protein
MGMLGVTERERARANTGARIVGWWASEGPEAAGRKRMKGQ